MKMPLVTTLLMAAGLAAWGQEMPRMVSVDPPNGKAGDVIAASGENLRKDAVAKLYLTDGKNDIEVTITEQSDTEIKFRIPAKAGGSLALMTLTNGKEPKLIEQPVRVRIEP